MGTTKSWVEKKYLSVKALDLLFMLLMVKYPSAFPTPDAKTKQSKSQLKRWLNEKAIQINYSFPTPEDKIQLPITNLVFFPRSKRRITYV